MQHQTIGAMRVEKRIRGGSRPPLRTLAEIADQLGVSAASLRGAISADSGAAPKPKFVKNGIAKSNWYSPSEIAQWWKSRASSQH